jgi:hypothetical protein
MTTDDNSIKTRTAGFPKNDGIYKPKYTVSHPIRLTAVGTSHPVTSVGLSFVFVFIQQLLDPILTVITGLKIQI